MCHPEFPKTSPENARKSDGYAGAGMKFSELVRRLEANGFTIVKEKGSIRYYGKEGWDRLIRVDYHGPKEVPTGTCHAILKAAGLTRSAERGQR